jgi:Holliday junction DNA helicase RuvA
MIAQIRGDIVQTGDKWVVLDVRGVGYLVYMTQPALQALQHRTDQVTLHTHMVVREDAITLYGFLHHNELEVFSILIGVSGIGPQTALSILSQIGIEDLVLAIVDQDERVLTGISKVGPKSAKRLILELRDKMKKVSETMMLGEGIGGKPAAQDAVSALVSLGFTVKESKDAVLAAAADAESPTVQQLIRVALVKLKEN